MDPVRALWNLPGTAVFGISRLVEEATLIRISIDDSSERLNRDVDELKAEIRHMRSRLDEVADTAPTKGPFEKVKDVVASG